MLDIILLERAPPTKEKEKMNTCNVMKDIFNAQMIKQVRALPEVHLKGNFVYRPTLRTMMGKFLWGIYNHQHPWHLKIFTEKDS